MTRRTAVALFALIGLASNAAADEARYRVTFDATWSSTTHPTNFPPNPHFSPLIGGTHNGAATFWAVGALASQGIKDMAERGLKSPLDTEIGGSTDADSVLCGVGIGSPGSTSLEFTVTSEFSHVTLVTMLAPSPDWFAGVNGLDLFEHSAWVQRKVVSLFAYDAGTDSGTNYTSANNPTTPPIPIVQITSGPLGNGVPIGTFTFERLDPAPVPATSTHTRIIVAVVLLATAGIGMRRSA